MAGRIKLTFNTTSLLSSELASAGFIETFPIRRRADDVRRLFLKPEIVELLNGSVTPPSGFPTVEADNVIGRFCAGWLVTVSERSNRAELERLERLPEAWALCFRTPKPGWRVLGRFWASNVFVGLAAFDRHELGPIEKYTEYAEQMIEEWSAVFPKHPPHTGAFPNDYLTGVVQNVDE